MWPQGPSVSQETCRAPAERPVGSTSSAGGAEEERMISKLTRAAAGSRTNSKTGTIVAAALLGALFIYTVGFMPVEAMHNYAHDTRHSVTVPCH